MGTATYAIIMTIAISAIAIIAIVFTRGEGALATSSLVESPAGRDALCAPHHIASKSELDEVAAACSFNDLSFNRYPTTAKMLYKCDTSLLHGEYDPKNLDYDASTLHTKYGDVIDSDIGDGCELVPSAVDAEYCTEDAVSQGYCVGSGVDYTALAYGRGPGQSCEDWNTQATVWDEGYDSQYVSLLEAECSGSDDRRLDHEHSGDSPQINPGCQEDMFGAQDSRCQVNRGVDVYEIQYNINPPRRGSSYFHVHFHNTGSVEPRGSDDPNRMDCHLNHGLGTQWNRPQWEILRGESPEDTVTFHAQWQRKGTTTETDNVGANYPVGYISGDFSGDVLVKNARFYSCRDQGQNTVNCCTYTQVGDNLLVQGSGRICGIYIHSSDYRTGDWLYPFRSMCGCDQDTAPFCEDNEPTYNGRSCSCGGWVDWPRNPRL